MRHRSMASMATASASILVIGVALAAQDKYAVKSPSGIAFSEFRGYEAWQTISVSQPDDEGGCGTSPAPGCIKVILGNPAMVKAYAEGIPANGKPVPDGAAFAKVEWQKGSLAKTAYDVTVPGKHTEVAFMLKDSKRFPKTNGWGYATFKPDPSSEAFIAFGDGPEFVQACHGCHTLVKARDFVFTDYSKR